VSKDEAKELRLIIQGVKSYIYVGGGLFAEDSADGIRDSL
jgi:hypothetical protein